MSGKRENKRHTTPSSPMRSNANTPTWTLTSSTLTSFLARLLSSWNVLNAPVEISIATISASRTKEVSSVRLGKRSLARDEEEGDGGGGLRARRCWMRVMMSGYCKRWSAASRVVGQCERG